MVSVVKNVGCILLLLHFLQFVLPLFSVFLVIICLMTKWSRLMSRARLSSWRSKCVHVERNKEYAQSRRFACTVSMCVCVCVEWSGVGGALLHILFTISWQIFCCCCRRLPISTANSRHYETDGQSALHVSLIAHVKLHARWTYGC